MNFQDLAAFLDKITQKQIPGADCTIRIGGKEVFRYQAGYADVKTKRPLTSEQLYNLYSATKISTCAAALQLYEKGMYLMTDPLWEYLPEFKTMYVEKRKMNGECELVCARNDIRIRDLFKMTAGFTYDMETPHLQKLVKDTDGKCTTRECVGAIAKTPLIFEPGTRWNYSLCHDVLGALIEVLSGKSFGEYLKENIFDPLGMKETGFVLGDENRSRMASQYSFNDETGIIEEIDLNNGFFKKGTVMESGGAGLISSVDDYVLFLDALCNMGKSRSGEYILSSKSVDLMRMNHLDEVQMRDFDWAQLWGYGYGLGVRTLINKAEAGALGNCGEFGWSGAAGAFAMMDPKEDLTVFYIQHMMNSQEPSVHPRLRALIYSGLEK